MAAQTLKNPSIERLRVGLMIAAAAIFFVAFSFWSGVPRGEKALPFWIGIAVLVGVLAGFGFATWHLLFRPMNRAVQVQMLPLALRQSLALLLALSSLGIIVGLFWDEIWHRVYGVPFGDDFFWRPHLLMYFGFFSVTALAFIGLYLISRKKGTFQRRFRANPLIGTLILLGAFLMYVLGADPIWHSIYGIDLTAWGIPHFVLISSFVLVLLMAVSIYMTAQPARQWSFRLSAADALPLVMFATIFLVWNQFWITEFDSGPPILNRPLWLLSVLIAGGPALIGTLALHSLRRYGAATVSGLLALALRSALIALFDARDIMFADAWILALPVCVAVDVAFFVQRSWIFSGIAAALTMTVVTATIMGDFYTYYPARNLPLTAFTLLIGCLITAWIGAQVGTAIANSSREAEIVGTRWPLYSLGAVLVAAVFVVFFVTTAAPPV